jgi:branched-chain amino acid transport system permease protein
MTFIGGIGQYWGPILSAVLVTFLQSALSTYTQAWLLYFGLLFLVILLFSPGGIANLIVLHKPVWQAGLTKRLLPSYALAAATGALMLCGFVGLVEMIYHLESREAAVKSFRLFAIPLDPARFSSWFGVLLVLVLGIALLAWSSRFVRRAWSEITPELQEKGMV